MGRGAGLKAGGRGARGHRKVGMRDWGGRACEAMRGAGRVVGRLGADTEGPGAEWVWEERVEEGVVLGGGLQRTAPCTYRMRGSRGSPAMRAIRCPCEAVCMVSVRQLRS